MRDTPDKIESGCVWALLGYAGVLQFFDIELLGLRREVILRPNSSFPGQVTVLRPPPP